MPVYVKYFAVGCDVGSHGLFRVRCAEGGAENGERVGAAHGVKRGNAKMLATTMEQS